ncbi:MAG: hypothetical protein JRI65_11205 [Deltaproteobacteria bacterium]|nr:hypothetical protein [Deltaproteobacteria bacterium]
MDTPEKIYCLEISLIPLSELIIGQATKSNVRWFTYPFIPPTAFSGFLHSVIFKDDPHNFIELNDGSVRRIEDKFKGVYSLGAYPAMMDGKIRAYVGEHYRQHFKDKFNYESFIWSTRQNKKLAVVEHLWSDILKGFIISEEKGRLEEISHELIGRVSRIGKKGGVQIIKSKIYLLDLETEGIDWCSIFSPIERVREFLIDSKIYTIPISSKKGNKKKPIWRLVPVMIGAKITAPYYKNSHEKVVIPVGSVKLLST